MNSGPDALRSLLAASQYARPEDLARSLMEVAPLVGATELVIHLVDYQQTHLMPFSGGGVPPRESTPIDGTVPGRAFSTLATVETGQDGARHLWIPLLDGTERLGVLEVVAKEGLHDEQRHACVEVAALAGELVAAKQKYGDTVELTRRRMPMLLAAEIVWSLLPPLTFSTPRCVVTGILEPCYEVGGDVFDYAIDGNLARVAMFDAMGHGATASLLSTITVSAYRNARRCGLDIVDTYRSMDKWIRAEYQDVFVTAILAELDLHSGALRIINAGHPAPLLLRDRRLVKALTEATALPLGLDDGNPDVVTETLQPGDRVLVYTDGVIDARSLIGDFFGLDRLVDFVVRANADGLPAPETMRRLIQAILRHQHENLQDDASALMLEWRGGPE